MIIAPHVFKMSGTNTVILPRDFIPALLTFGEPKQLESGGRSIYLAYDGQPFSVQTPEMSAPFGMSNYRDRAGGVGPDKFTLDLSFKGIAERPNVQKFFSMLETIDKMMIDYGLANSQTLFKKRHTSAEVVAALYTPAIKFAKDRNTGEVNERYPPTFKMALPQKDGRFLCETYDARRNRIELSDMDTKGSSITAITRCVAIWVINGKFGVTWKAQQLRVTPSANLRGYAFKETDEDLTAETVDDDGDVIAVPRRQQQPRAVKRGLITEDGNDGDRTAPSARGVDVTTCSEFNEFNEESEPPPAATASSSATSASARAKNSPFM